MSRSPVITTALVLTLVLAAPAAASAAAPDDDLPDPPRPGAPAAAPPSAAAPAPAPAPARGPAAPAPGPAPVPDEQLPPLPRPGQPAGAAPAATGTTAPAPGHGAAAAPAPHGDLGPPSAAAPPAAEGHGPISVGGYGEAQAFASRSDHHVEARLRRFVVSLGARFSDSVRALGDVEIENGTTVGVERAQLEVAPSPYFGVRAGLMLVPLGIINQLHEPASYLTVDRPLTDQLIVPTTWRELGVGIFGDVGAGLTYQGAVMTGLDPTGVDAQAPLAGARGNGRDVAVHDVAFAGRVDYAGLPGFDVGAAGYAAGASGGRPELDGVRVGIFEADARLGLGGFDLRAEYAHVFIIDSYKLNDYFGLTGAQAISARGRGFYFQAGYDLLRIMAPESAQELVLFAGYENVNARSRMSPYNFNPPAITGPGQPEPNAPSAPKSFVRAGLTYRPRPQVALKVDVQIALGAEGVPAAAAPLAGAPGTLQPLPAELAEAAKGESRLGLAAAFSF